MPTPAIKHDDTRDPQNDLEYCPTCGHFAWRGLGHDCDVKPRMSWASPIVGLALVAITALMVIALLYLAFSDEAHAREGAIHPVPIPASHARARATCPLDRPLKCRASLVHAYQALEWTQKARRDDAKRSKGYGVQHALRLASALYGVPLRELRAVGSCESHLTPTSQNRTSTAAGVFQFLDSTWARAGLPGFSVYDAYANILAAARLVTTDGSWREWTCQP